MKKFLSGLTALLLLLSVCAGCGNNETPDSSGSSDTPANGETDAPKGVYYDLTGIDPQETVLEYGGNTAPAELYFYWLSSACSDLEYYIGMYNAYYGMYGDVVDEEGNIIWDANLDGATPAQAAISSADSNVLSYLVLENMAAENNVTLTGEDRAEMEAALAQQIAQAGGEEGFQEQLALMGVSRETFDRLAAGGHLLTHLEELAADPSSAFYEAPSQEDNAYVDHILLGFTDPDTGENLSEEEIAAKRAQAEDFLEQLRAAEDVEALFNRLVEEYGEDPGRAAETGYLVNPETSFVPEFLEATFALKPGEFSGIVESDYGYHILLRKELTEEQIASLAGSHMIDLLNERMETALGEMKRSEKLDSVDAGAFYQGYMDFVKQSSAAEDGAAE